MRTGIKTLFRKIATQIKHPNFALTSLAKTEFPTNGLSHIRRNLFLYSLKNELKEMGYIGKVGNLFSFAHPFSLKTQYEVSKLNPNNLGNWSDSKIKNLTGTRKIEQQLIKIVSDFYGARATTMEGYVTTGGSEANIFALWLARNALKSKTQTKVCIIANQLTHYSIYKSADLLDIPIYTSKLDRERWTFAVEALKKTVLQLATKNYKAIIVPLTLGYSQTGTNDPIELLIPILKQLEHKLGLKIFVHVDACFNGLVLPFSIKDFKPLKNPYIQTFCVDFHKAGATPVGHGIILYKPSLKKYVQKKIPYLKEQDSTLLGSRPGSSASTIYAALVSLGQVGYKKRILNSQDGKNKFIKEIVESVPNVEIVNEKGGIAIGIVSKTKLPQNICDKYGLYSNLNQYNFEKHTEKLYVYKASFLPKP